MAEFTPAPVKPTVAITALEALDVRVGTIERVEEIPRSDKLMKLTVNFGDHFRTILTGIKKERSNPREIEGRQALFVVNLEPRKNGRRSFRRYALRYRLRRRCCARARRPGARCSQRHSRWLI